MVKPLTTVWPAYTAFTMTVEKFGAEDRPLRLTWQVGSMTKERTFAFYDALYTTPSNALACPRFLC